MSVQPQIVADFETQLSAAISIGDVTLSLASILDDDGNTIPDGLYLLTIDNGTASKEYVAVTKSGTNFTGLMHVSRQGVQTSGATKAHRVGASVVMTDFLTYKAYLDNAILSGAVDATTSVKGLVEVATAAEVLAKTQLGGTGATLAVSPDNMASTLKSDYKVDTGTANTYVITPNPAITAYVAGQEFSFKAANANNGASTLNVNGLGAKTLKKNISSDLATGDIGVGQIVTVEYDGTNFQVTSMFGAPASAKFGGTGADGALSITSGTTSIDLGGAQTVVKNYTSISITGTGALAFTNPHANGTTIVLRSQGAVTITTSATRAIDVRNLGGAGGSAGASGTGNGAGGGGGASLQNSGTAGAAGTSGTAAGDGTDALGPFTIPKGLKGTGSTAGTGGVAPMPTFLPSGAINTGVIYLAPGAGGGGGGGGAVSSSGGTGGRGGGALLIECAGALNITGTIDASGAAGGGGGASAGAGGGGGGGGCVVILYNTLTANSGTYTVNGGTFGTGQQSGGTGGAGYFLVAANLLFN